MDKHRTGFELRDNMGKMVFGRLRKCCFVVVTVVTCFSCHADLLRALFQGAAGALVEGAVDSYSRNPDVVDFERRMAILKEEEQRKKEEAERRAAQEMAARKAREEAKRRAARVKAERIASERRAAIERDRTVMKARLEDPESNNKDFVLILPGGERMEMVYCPKGTFTMGSPESEIEREDEEETQHKVTLTKDFWIGKYEVSQIQWTKVMGYNPSANKGDSYPVENVSWIECQKFLKRVARVEPSARLPTEAEWEYACRAGSEGKFGGTGALRDMAWSAESRSHVGGEKMPNAWGIYDMHGNVAEWCGDFYVDFSGDVAVDPKCTSGGTLRVCRGGCFKEEFPEKACRSAARARMLPRQKQATVGFRIVCTSRPVSAEDLKCRPNSEAYLDDEVKRSENKRGQQSSGIVKTRTITLPGGATLELVWCPPGSFTMGSPTSEEGHENDEKQHQVTLTKGFWLGKYEVTQRQWESVMGANPSWFKDPDRPVEQVSWEDCQAFVRAVQREVPEFKVRLPTEAEWEYACRAGTETALPNGLNLKIVGTNNGPALDDIAWYGGNSSVGFELSNGFDCSEWPEMQYRGDTAGSHPVGRKKANDWGLYDMIGNVWEWCSDWYNEDFNETLDPENTSSPQMVRDVSDRVVRGGGWVGNARGCRSAFRNRAPPSDRGSFLGFRLCCSAGPRE